MKFQPSYIDSEALVFIICTGYFRTIKFMHNAAKQTRLCYMGITLSEHHLWSLTRTVAHCPESGSMRFLCTTIHAMLYSPKPKKVLKMFPSGSQICGTRNYTCYSFKVAVLLVKVYGLVSPSCNGCYYELYPETCPTRKNLLHGLRSDERGEHIPLLIILF